MYNTHSPAEWASMVCLATSVYAGLSAPYFVFVDADLADFDPRPALARSQSPLWQAAVHAGHDLNRAIASGEHHAREFATNAGSFARLSLRDAALTATALLALLTITPGDAR
jgi:hypothetical protein